MDCLLTEKRTKSFDIVSWHVTAKSFIVLLICIYGQIVQYVVYQSCSNVKMHPLMSFIVPHGAADNVAMGLFPKATKYR